MKVSVRAGHILSPSLRPPAVGRATELCPALSETFLSLQGDLTNPILFNHELFNHDFLNHGVEKFMVEKSGVEMFWFGKFMVEKSGVEAWC